MQFGAPMGRVAGPPESTRQVAGSGLSLLTVPLGASRATTISDLLLAEPLRVMSEFAAPMQPRTFTAVVLEALVGPNSEPVTVIPAPAGSARGSAAIDASTPPAPRLTALAQSESPVAGSSAARNTLSVPVGANASSVGPPQMLSSGLFTGS